MSTGRSSCKSRTHFVRCVESVEGKKDRVKWKCDHCNEYIFNDKQFRSNAARVHLAARSTNGTCVNLCRATDEDAVARHLEFRELIDKLKAEKKFQERKRK